MREASRCVLLAAFVCLMPLQSPSATPRLLTPGTATGRLLTPDDVSSLASVGGAALSPDGKRVAALISRNDFIDNRSVSSLVIIDVATGEQRAIAPGRARIGGLKWSPNGDRLAWVDAAEDGRSQIYVLAMDKPGARAVSVTNIGTGVGAYDWNPDGGSFAILSSEAPEVRAGEERHNKSFDASRGDYMAKAAPGVTHLWVAPVSGGAAKRITSGKEGVGSMGWAIDMDWLDARSVVIVQRPRDFREASLQVVNVTDGSRRTLVAPPAADQSPLQTLFGASPDGTRVAFGRVRGPLALWYPNGVVSVTADGKNTIDLSATVDRSFRELVWAGDSKSAFAAASDETRYSIWQLPIQGAAKKLALGDITMVTGLSASNTGALAFVGSTAYSSNDLYVMTSPTAKPKRLTNLNPQLETLRLGRVGNVSWQLDGFNQQGVLTYPAEFVPGKKYPLVLVIHGGPMSSSSESFSTLAQLMAARGWLVFEPNYRGSNSTCTAFMTAVINDSGEGPGRDIMAGIDAVKRLGIVDESRIAASGWSYGGYMTGWLISHYPTVWRAAVAGAAITDWHDSYNLSDLNRTYAYPLNGSPWRDGNGDNFRKQSVLESAERIRTPTLILHNVGDRRVPITNAYKLYHALEDNGVPVQFIAYPVEGHSMPDPVHQRDMQRRWIGWIDARFRDEPLTSGGAE
ncbi:alpha/beta hydrolase family protein [Steroidobacter sp.]|uniref:S9 family peptidase n=1 Tax=Steroidobacter sp. TaxID=1978227 RepID=UPI001A4EA698|nr:S9 family peptidase [Steroidobacter sp.]MBL8265443.1 S9 family peptidase [Steroidobacter sp.]